LIEIRWHGRGGQGAKTAALLLADAAFAAGLYVQGFPEYGPERMGAPITAYNRLDENVIRVHSNIYKPDMVVVVDESLIGPVDVTAGLKDGGKIIVNSQREPAEVKAAFAELAKTHGLDSDKKAEIYMVDAAGISKRNLGKNLPNTPLLSVAARLAGVMDKDKFFGVMQEAYEEKFAAKPEVIEGNMNALKEAWDGLSLIGGTEEAA